MNCYRPVLVFNPRYDSIVRQINFIDHCSIDRFSTPLMSSFFDVKEYRHFLDLDYGLTPRYHFVPCRRCPACLKMRSREWQGRLSREFEYHRLLGRKSLFVTLTYDNEYISNARDTYKKDIATLFDRLRSKFRRNIRHFCISELGEKKGRFHVHAIFFDCPPSLAPDSHFHRSKNGALMGSNSILKERWGKGIVDVGYCKAVAGCAYVAKYLLKNSSDPYNAKSLFSPIVSSNGLGFQDLDLVEINRLRTDVLNLRTPFYSIGNNRYSYPFSILRKCLDYFDRKYLSLASERNALVKGGYFSYGSKYFKTYLEYRSYLDSVLSAVYVSPSSSVLFDNYVFNIRPDCSFERFSEYSDYDWYGNLVFTPF